MAGPDHPWRCFVAVPIGDELRQALAALVGRFQTDSDLARDWRWTDAAGWHVTLAFLGATDPREVARLADGLTTVAETVRPFGLGGSSSLGAFPSRRRARVLWYGFSDPDGDLRQLARAVQESVGLVAEDRFHAHLTLARARDRSGTDASAALQADPPMGRIAVDRLVLYRSHLGRGAAHYEQIAAAALKGTS